MKNPYKIGWYVDGKLIVDAGEQLLENPYGRIHYWCKTDDGEYRDSSIDDVPIENQYISMYPIPETVKCGQFCIIDPSVEIGEGTVIGDYVKIEAGTVIGKGCYIGDYSKIEGSVLKDHVTLQGRNRIGKRCILHEDVVMKYNAILTSDAEIGKGVFLGVQSVTLGSDADKEQIPGTFICEYSYIGGQSIIGPGVKITETIVLGANSFLKEFNGTGTYIGNPAKKK